MPGRLPGATPGPARIDFNRSVFDDVLVSWSCNTPPTNSPVHVFLGTGQTTFADGIQTVVGSETDRLRRIRLRWRPAPKLRHRQPVRRRHQPRPSHRRRLRRRGAPSARSARLAGNFLAISAGDIDGSGVADEIVAAVSTGSSVSLYLLMNPVDGPPLHAVALDEDTTRVFAVGDWNGDGIADIAAATPGRGARAGPVPLDAIGPRTCVMRPATRRCWGPCRW